MVKGHFIRLGDKTTCGGEVLEADDAVTMVGIAHAREGDAVSCGKDGKQYTIKGGVSYIRSNGRQVAGHLDSYSGCPCKAELTPSYFAASYESSQSAAPHATRTAAQPVTPAATRPSAAPRQSSFAPSPSYPAPAAFNSAEAQEPGFYIVPKSMTREQLEASLFTVRDPAVMHKFQLLNPYLGDIKAGSMIVLSDPNNLQCTREEALLMQAAAKTNDALKPLSNEEADFMAQNHDEIATFLSHSSTAIGVGSAMYANNLQNLKHVLNDIEVLHQRAFQTNGHLRSPEFFVERKRLLAQLNSNLTAMTRKDIGFPYHPNLKSALGLSSRSLVHRWTKAGAAGQIPGYATHIEGVAKAAPYIKWGGRIGIAVGAGASSVKVYDVCTAGNTEACKRVAFTEVGSVAGGVAGGYLASAALTANTVGGLCVALGVPTGGLATVVCGLVVVAAGSLAAGTLAGGVGGKTGEIIYEATN